jgi:hypothetical protein
LLSGSPGSIHGTMQAFTELVRTDLVVDQFLLVMCVILQGIKRARARKWVWGKGLIIIISRRRVSYYTVQHRDVPWKMSTCHVLGSRRHDTS